MGGKNSTTTSQVSIPPEVLARYNAVNTQAETVSKTPFQAFGSAPSDFVAQMNNQQGAGINRINETAGSYQPYMAGATGATLAGMAPASAGIDNYMSPYIKNVADTTGALMKQQQEQAQSGALGTAISSGAFGGDRAGIAAANLQQQNQMGYGKTMADIYNQGYTQALGASQADLARQMQGGAQLAGLGAQSQELGLQGAQAQIAAGTMQQQTEQAGKDAMIKSFMQEKGYPFQVAQFLANIAMGTGALSGSTTTATQPTSLFGFFKDGGKVNGYAGGGGVSGPRTDSQSGLFEDGYVPPADLPIGQLMVADPPSDQGGGGGLGDVVKIVSSIGGMKNGGVAGGRHGYATDGYVGPESAEEARRRYQEGELSVFDSLLANSPASAASPRNIGQVMPPAGGLVPYTPPPVTPSEVPAGLGASSVDPTPRMVYRDPNPPEAGEVPTGLGAGRVDETPIADRSVPPPPRMIGGLQNPDAPGRPSDFRARATEMGLGEAVAADAMSALGGESGQAGLGMAPIQEVRAFPTASVPDTPTGVSGKPAPIIPLKTQLDFVMHELQKPMYSGYLGNEYRSAGDAAVAFDKIYERSGGAGNDRAEAYAEDVHAAAQAGDMSGLPPNVVTAYNHFVQSGMTPKQAAGATGRLMVESYAHVDPNARNTLGGGNGTYGAAQWRGSRMEELANFAGVPLEALTGAPVSTPEGRYYPSSPSTREGGLGAANMPQEPRSGGLGGNDPLRINKPYEDRNLIGKFFHDRETGKLNPDAILSLLSGLSAMGQARTVSPIGAILAGLGGGAETYTNLRQNAPERVAKNLENTQNALRAYEMYKMNGGTNSFQDWSKTLETAGPDYLSGGAGAGQAAAATGREGAVDSFNGIPLDPLGRGMRMETTLNVNGQPVKVMAGQTYGYLKALETRLTEAAGLGIRGAAETLAQVQRAIDNHNGQIVLQNGTTVSDPTFEGSAFGATRLQSDIAQTGDINKNLASSMTQARNSQRNTAELAKALSVLPATGKLAGWSATYANIANNLGLDVDTSAADGYEIASKAIANSAQEAVRSLAGKADTAMVEALTRATTPNQEMTPRAIEELLSIQAGIADYDAALAAAKMEAQQAGVGNLAEVEREFVRKNSPDSYIEDRRKDFAGTIKRPAKSGSELTAESAPDGTTSTYIENGVEVPIVKQNGQWVRQ